MIPVYDTPTVLDASRRQSVIAGRSGSAVDATPAELAVQNSITPWYRGAGNLALTARGHERDSLIHRNLADHVPERQSAFRGFSTPARRNATALRPDEVSPRRDGREYANT